MNSPNESRLPRLYDIKEVAGALKCCPRHVQRLVDSGRIPSPVRVGHLVRFRAEDIEEWLASGCQPVSALRHPQEKVQ